MKKEQLILLVSNPNQSFVKTEIETFAKLVKQLFVISTTHELPYFELPNNVVYTKFSLVNYKTQKIDYDLVGVFVKDSLVHLTNYKYLNKSKEHFSTLRQANYLKQSLKNFIVSNNIEEETPILSFWCDIWAVAMALLKRENTNVKVYSRLHGRDLYEERKPTTTFAIPFRPFVVKQLDGLFPISKHGSAYLANKYPLFKDKIKASYLGCPDYKVCDNPSKTLTIISIATVRHVKRIHRIAEVVKNYPKAIHWIHIGGEANRLNDPTIAYTEKIINEIKLVQNKQVTLMGMVDVNEIESIVNQFNPHVLVNTSEYEGLPVSVMEALSMGVPCIATDVGGTKEMINEKTGLLLNAQFTNDQLIEAIEHISSNWLTNKIEYRKTTKLHWMKTLNPIKNREQFIKWV